MTPERDELELRLAQIDPYPPDAGPQVGSTEWGTAIRDGIVRGGKRSRRPARARRAGGIVLAGLGVAALAGLMAILIVAGGGSDQPPPPVTTATYRAISYPGGPAVSRQTLDETVRLLNRRASATGQDDVHARLAGQGRIVISAPGASAERLDGLIAVGRLAVYARGRAFVGDAKGTLAAAVHAARVEAGVPVTGTGTRSLPPEFAIVREKVQTPTGPGVRFQALRGRPALTEADVADARPGSYDVEPTVTLTFTSDGEAAFADLTRTLARDGALEGRLQSFAVVMDGTLITSPTIDYTKHPAGLDGRDGFALHVGSPSEADAMAARLSDGPLPLRLSRAQPLAHSDGRQDTR